MRKIVVATRHSTATGNTLRYAANLAHSIKANLLLFNVYHFSHHSSYARLSPKRKDRMLKNNRDSLRRLASTTARRHRLHVSWVSKTDDTLAALEDYTADHQTDLVVMGIESDMLECKLFGNTTIAAIRSMKFPVLVVPKNASFKKIKKILFACKHPCNHSTHLDLLREIARKSGATLKVCHIDTQPQEALAAQNNDSALEKAMRNITHTYGIIQNSKIVNGICKGLEAFGADLLVLEPHKARLPEVLLRNDITREMILKTRIPLLVLPNA